MAKNNVVGRKVIEKEALVEKIVITLKYLFYHDDQLAFFEG